MLLPINISEGQLASLFATALQKSYPKNNSCCLSIEKIYFINTLKYIIVYYGPLVSHQVKLTDELNFIYGLLRNGDESLMDYRKLVKELREKYGMVNLLRNIFECQKYYKNSKTIDRLCEFIKDKRLLSIGTIENLMKNQKKKI
jgi:hypothetical protein